MFHNVMIDEGGGGIDDGFANHANLAVSDIEPMGLFAVSCLTVLIPLFPRHAGAEFANVKPARNLNYIFIQAKLKQPILELSRSCPFWKRYPLAEPPDVERF